MNHNIYVMFWIFLYTLKLLHSWVMIFTIVLLTAFNRNISLSLIRQKQFYVFNILKVNLDGTSISSCHFPHVSSNIIKSIQRIGQQYFKCYSSFPTNLQRLLKKKKKFKVNCIIVNSIIGKRHSRGMHLTIYQLIQ